MGSGLLLALVLNEVLYDPAGADGGREFVEILATSSDARVSLAGVELQVGDGARPGTWRTVWRAARDSLDSWVPFVIGGDSLPERHARLDGSLQNGPDAVRLWRDGVTLDLLGYGDLDDATLYESRPAADVSGASLARLPDGVDRDDNAADWQRARPSPGRRNLPQRDWELQGLEPDVTRLWPFREQELLYRVHNRGRETLDAGTPRVLAQLQRLHGEPYLGPVQRDPPRELRVDAPAVRLAAHDSLEFGVRWLAEPGLFEVGVHAQGTDEDSSNNRVTRLVRFGAGDVLVHEILFAPHTGEPEWIELHNRGTRSHDLDGWTLEDAGRTRARLHASRALAPGAFAVVSADSVTTISALEPHALRIVATPWPSLNNSDGADGVADRVVLRDPLDVVQDAVFYRAAWGVARGRSIERLTLDPDARGVLWSTSKDALGATPGRANSARAPAAASVRIHLHPNPFSPDADGVEDLLGAAFEVPAGASGFEASIFDLEGRRRRWLAADRLGPGPRRLAWDGTDDRGNELEEGVYVLHLELLGSSAPTNSQMRCIGLVRGRRPLAGSSGSSR